MAYDLKQLLALQSRKFLNLIRWCGSRSPVVGAVSFYVCETCNLRCGMCWVGKKNLDQEPLDKGHMDPALLEKGLREVAGWTPKPRIHLIGGEPLMYRHLKPAAELCRELGFRWGFTTNGWFLARDARMLVENRCHAVNVSVDGTQETHDTIRGVSHSFEKALEGIRQLHAVKAELGNSIPAVAVNCVINVGKQHHLGDVVAAFADSGAQTVNLQHLIWGADFNADLASRIEPQVLSAFMDKVDAGAFPIRVSLYPPLSRDKLVPYYQRLDDPALGSSCAVPWLVLRVDQHGEAAICMDNLGNLKDHTLAEMWNGHAARQMRTKVLKTPLFDPSYTRCCHRQY